MVIRDWETYSVWQHTSGEAIAGPLKGKRLPLIGGSLMKWEAWQTAYPDGVLGTEPDPPAPNLRSVEGMVEIFSITHKFSGPGREARKDHRLPLHEIVIGLQVNGEACAYSLEVLRQLGEISDILGGEAVILSYNLEGDRVTAEVNGKPIPALRQWWLGWVEFHPHTEVYQPD